MNANSKVLDLTRRLHRERAALELRLNGIPIGTAAVQQYFQPRVQREHR